ncbi:MAG: hypothetical protein FXV79_02185 [Candidatus Thioglobus sp.]|nr:MAG: hypothetical protein FXV80_00335 [Candidatus Thioglobus sp.]KAA0452468.1 MAG: hypothetical protein FXV79_02185 [Candidatus Thioglobus sp.]
MSKKITNLANFAPHGALGLAFTQARKLGHLNSQLLQYLPEPLQSLSLCAFDDNTATFVADNQALAFRAQKQSSVLLEALWQIEALTQIKKVAIKVDLQKY